MRRESVWALVAGVFALLAAFGLSAQPGPAAGGGRGTTPPTARVMQWGAFLPHGLAQTAPFESLVGRKMDLQAVFVGWDEDGGAFPMNYGPLVRDQGKTLVIYWEVMGKSAVVENPKYSNDSIIAGHWDKYLISFATAARRYGGPVILLPMPEMNGNWYPWCGTVNGNSPTKFVAAWRHIHGFFVGLNNVKLGWAVNSNSVPNTPGNAIARYYPGDAFVDYVGVDGFNFAGNPWPNASFREVFGETLGTLARLGKPVYIFSVAAAQSPLKAEWILDALGTQIHRFPVEGWIWFNVYKGVTDWRVDADPKSLAAFRRVLSDHRPVQ